MRYIVVILLFLLLGACHSNTKTMKQNSIPLTVSDDAKNITYANFSDSIFKAVMHYDVEPIYMVYMHNEQCYYELLINDVLLDRYFKEGKQMSPFYINDNILKSGKQTLTYRLYPNTGMGLQTLADFTDLKVEIGVVDQKKAVSFSNMDTVLVHHVAKNADDKFIATGKDYYEFTIEFEAKVPYEEIGWTKSKDLRKMDPDELLTKTEQAYEYIVDVINKKEKDVFAKFLYEGSRKEHVTNFDGIDGIKNGVATLEFYMTEKTLKMNPLKDYKLDLLGNGRVVTLKLTNTDPFFRFKSAIGGFFIDEDGDRSLSSLWFFLHIPEGKDTFEML